MFLNHQPKFFLLAFLNHQIYICPKTSLNHQSIFMALKTDKYPIKDFFIADIFDNTPFKDDIASMENPFFVLSKKKDMRCLEYRKDNISISITPNLHGLPTIMDKDILLYCGSLIVAGINRGETPNKTLRISCRDLLFSTNRPISGESYNRLRKALDRLTGVKVKTNIKTNKREQTNSFGFIDSYRIIESSKIKNRMIRLEITLSEWFYNSLLGNEVLTINRDYFRLSKPLERRLYEIARKHCGKQDFWSIGLTNLIEKTGSTGSLRKFRFFIKEIAESNHLPDYTISINDDDKVTFYNRKPLIDDDNQPLLGFDSNLPIISLKTMDIARDIVRNSGTGWDFYALEDDFKDSLRNGFKPDNVNGAFINFIKNKVAKAP